VEIGAGYSLDRASAGGPHQYGFALDTYDCSKPLVLDPAVFVYAGYIGGSGDDYGIGIAVDSSGSAYVTGATSSEATFPVTVGPDLTYNGNGDAFVAKIASIATPTPTPTATPTPTSTPTATRTPTPTISATVPTLSGWALALLGVALAALGYLLTRSNR
jgi:hypothetical protein